MKEVEMKETAERARHHSDCTQDECFAGDDEWQCKYARALLSVVGENERKHSEIGALKEAEERSIAQINEMTKAYDSLATKLKEAEAENEQYKAAIESWKKEEQANYEEWKQWNTEMTSLRASEARLRGALELIHSYLKDFQCEDKCDTSTDFHQPECHLAREAENALKALDPQNDTAGGV